MTAVRAAIVKAGSARGLPFFLTLLLLSIPSVLDLSGKEDAVLTFQEFESTCIDLGHYDAGRKELTVRFVNPNRERFYRYAKVPAQVWKKLNALNELGGIGEYFNETILRNPETYPFEELTIRSFKTIAKKEKSRKLKSNSRLF